MKVIQNIIGGLAGALALNILHETFKGTSDKAPRIDLVGEEALSKTIAHLGYTPPVGNKLFAATLGADIAGNSMYYSLVGQGDDKNLLLRGATLGIAAGIGAVGLTGKLGLDDTPVTKTSLTKTLTIAWYFAGGIAAALVIKALRNR